MPSEQEKEDECEHEEESAKYGGTAFESGVEDVGEGDTDLLSDEQASQADADKDQSSGEAKNESDEYFGEQGGDEVGKIGRRYEGASDEGEKCDGDDYDQG